MALSPSLSIPPSFSPVLFPRNRAAELASAGQHSEKRVDGEHVNGGVSQVCL